jgi:flagella basal body P-ring formation protein FlgA
VARRFTDLQRQCLTITAAGTPLENAAIGDFIRVRNIESGLIVSGTVMDNGSIRVAAK